MRLSKLLASLAVVVLVAGFTAPVLGQANPGGDIPGRDEIKEDGKACFDAADPAVVTCTVLYGHLFNLLDPVPINVQFPNEQCHDLDRGFTSVPTVGPFDQAKQDLYSSPGFVEYEQGSIKDGVCDPRLHPERGITSDVIIDTSIPIMFYWYMSADTDDVSLAADPRDVNTGAMPCLEVTVQLWTGRHPGQGTLLAQGKSTRTVLSSKVAPETDLPTPDPCVDPATATIYPNLQIKKVHEFPVNLGPALGNIPKVEAFVIHVEWRQFSQTGSQKFAQREWNVHTGVEYRNRLVVPVLNPQRVEEVRPQLFEEKIYIHGVFNSPWGSYDVDPSSLKVEILKPDGSVFESSNLGEPILKFSVDHDAHFRPVNATFPWEYKKDNLPPGTYKIRMSSLNWQHTAGASNEATIELPSSYLTKPRAIKITSSEGVIQRNIVGKGVRTGGGPNIDLEGADEKGLPGFEGVVVLTAMLGAAAFAARRRKE